MKIGLRPAGRSFLLPPLFLLLSLAGPGLRAQDSFLRADSNDDGAVDLSDAIHTLGFLFLGGPAPPCPDAADADDSGVLDITDAIATLTYLFLGGRPPPDPGPSVPGPDPSPDDLSCVRPTDGDAVHPFEGTAPRYLVEVAYDVDASEGLDLDETRERIEGGADFARLRNGEHVAPRLHLYLDGPLGKFHFWPNIIALGEIEYRDPALAARILDEILGLDPDRAAIRAETDRALAEGHRIYLARDFVDEVVSAGRRHVEVHYALLIDLDARSFRELLAHDLAREGLGRPHDPHTDLLAAAFADAALSGGQVWDLCLRGNFLTEKFEAIVVDELGDRQDASAREFYIERVHGSCRGTAGELVPEPLFPFPIPPPPPPPGDPTPKDRVPLRPRRPGGPVPPPPPPGPGPDGAGGPPVGPWPFEDEVAPPPSTETPEEGPPAGSSPQDPPSTGCPPDERAAVEAKLAALQSRLDALIAERAADRAALRGFQWYWPDGVEFHDPCLRELLGAFDAQAEPIRAALAELQAQLGALFRRLRALHDSGDPLLDSATSRTSLWENMIYVGGAWSQVSVPCMPPWVPAGGNIFEDPTGGAGIFVTVEQQRRFQRSILYGVFQGKTFEEAVAAAIADDGNYPEGVRPRDTVWQLIWRQYADCLRKLYTKQLRIFLAAVFQDADDAQIEAMIAVLFDGPDALPPEARARWKEDRAQSEEIAGEVAALRRQIEALGDQLDGVRRAFRLAARDCLRASIVPIRELQARAEIFRAFLVHCEDPEAEEAWPLIRPGFCDQLRAIQADPDCAGLAGLQAWVRMLLDNNCG